MYFCTTVLLVYLWILPLHLLQFTLWCRKATQVGLTDSLGLGQVSGGGTSRSNIMAVAVTMVVSGRRRRIPMVMLVIHSWRKIKILLFGIFTDKTLWDIIWKSRGWGPKGFWPRDLLRRCIHYDTPKAFPYNVILLASRTSKEGFLSLAPNPTCD